jgi:hypothetical protein
MAKSLSKFAEIQPITRTQEIMKQEQVTPVNYSSQDQTVDRRLQALIAAASSVSYWGSAQGMEGTKDICDVADRFMHYALTGKHP